MVVKCSIVRQPCGELISAEPDDQFIGHGSVRDALPEPR